MPHFNRFLALFFGAAILLSGGSSPARHQAAAATRTATATGIGRDSATTVTAALATATQPTGIGWD